MMPRLTLAATALCVVLSAPAEAQDVRNYGPEFQVNSYTTYSQRQPALAVDGDGRVAVIWDDGNAPGGEAQARRAGIGDGPTSAQFPVDITAYYDAAGLTGGGIVVTGEGIDDGSVSGVSAVVFHPSNNVIGSEFQVNSYTPTQQRRPVVAGTRDGGFVVAWSGYGSGGDDDDSNSVAVRRFQSDGTAIGLEVQANTYTTSRQRFPAIAATPDGGFVVAWNSVGSTGTDSSLGSVQLRRFLSTGAPRGIEFQVNSYTTGYQDTPSLVVDAENRVLVVWRSNSEVITCSNSADESRGCQAGPVASILTIRGQVIAENGDAIGSELLLDADSDFEVRALAAPVADTFVVISENNLRDIEGQLVDASGILLPGFFSVNSYTTGIQSSPQVESTGLNGFVVTWKSDPNPVPDRSFGDDDSFTSVQLRRFGFGIFSDGFETGDEGQWSSLVGSMF